MKQRTTVVFASLSAAALASISTAQAIDAVVSPPQATVQGDDSVSLDEVIVTARRKEESLQDVPETVDVVSPQAVEKYNVLQFSDITKLIPGISVVQEGSLGTTASMRGVDYLENQVTPPTVTYYINDAPVNGAILFQSIFDIGDVEVLRGPTGTLRGEISPSGSLTLSTRKPDLDQIGGYVQGTLGTLHVSNVQGAFNLPLIQDKLAVRVAGLRDENALDDVHSVFNSAAPRQITEAGRISVLFDPVDNISALVSYQHMARHQLDYNSGGGSELAGSGSPGGLVPGTATPAPLAGYNGPPIGLYQRSTVSPYPETSSAAYDIANAQVQWHFLGQELSYVGSWNKIWLDTHYAENETNSIPGYNIPGHVLSQTKEWTQELRLSSETRILGHFDYTLGFFYNNFNAPTSVDQGPSYLPGAFGSPLAQPLVQAPDLRYALETSILGGNVQHEYAGFASVTLHLDDKTEITGGVRYSEEFQSFNTTVGFSPAYAAVPLPANICGFAHGQFGATYPGVCDIPVVESPFNFPIANTFHPVIYNAEISHRFNDQLMAYFRTGSSYRPGNIQLALAFQTNNPAFQKYLVPSPEESKTYEAGLKSAFLDKRVEFNIDFYHQIYSGLFYSTLPVYFLTTTGGQPAVAQTSFTANANAVVDGVELDATAKLTSRWSARAAFSLADGRLSDASIPCSPGGGTTTPTVSTFQAAGADLFTCKSSASTTTAPRWNANIESEYDHPINQSVGAFVRGLLYYYPSNPNSSINYVVPAYATVDLYLGLRRPDSGWEASVYGKNITNNQTITQLGATPIVAPAQSGNFFGSTGYYNIAHTPEREFGLTARYSFGSR